ncbi:MAG: hypothetical protein K0Q72_165 [Armatimonadetes bacterium]|jgi:hypothetical protein|nr:hypothetical protein [Armatimonadota bacterium]
MSFAGRATGSSRYDPDGDPIGEPPGVPRLHEYRVTPYSRRAEQRARVIRTTIYALCFVSGVAAGLGTAHILRPQPAASAAPVTAVAEQPVVTIRSLR